MLRERFEIGREIESSQFLGQFLQLEKQIVIRKMLTLFRPGFFYRLKVQRGL